MVNTSSFTQSLILLPLSVFGIFVGYKLLKIIEESLFYNAIYILILVASTKLIIDFFYANWMGVQKYLLNWLFQHPLKLENLQTWVLPKNNLPLQ